MYGIRLFLFHAALIKKFCALTEYILELPPYFFYILREINELNFYPFQHPVPFFLC